MPARRLPDRQRQPAIARHAAQRLPEGQAAAAAMRPEAARGTVWQREPHHIDGMFGLGNLGRRHQLEIHAAKMLVRR